MQAEITRTEARTIDTATSPSDLNAQTVAAYLELADLRPKSRATYERALRQFVRWLDGRGLAVNGLTADDVLQYRRDLELDHKPGTVNLYMSAVRGLYAWLNERTGYPNVARGVRGVSGSGTSMSMEHDALSVEQARRVAAHSDGDDLESLRNHAIVNLMIRVGLRTIEVVRANVGDLRTVAGRTALFVHGKGRAEAREFVMLDEAALAPISEYLRARGRVADDDPLFAGVGNRNRGRLTTRTVSRVAKRAMEAEGVTGPHFCAHSLRHTAATLALMGGAPVEEVQSMARHASVATTMIYVHSISRAKGVAERSVSAMLAG